PTPPSTLFPYTTLFRSVHAELIADAVTLTDAMQRDPGARGVADVVVEIVTRGPTGHRALLDAIADAARLGLLQQRDEDRLERFRSEEHTSELQSRVELV